MDTLKKCDTRKRQSAGRNKGQRSFTSADKTGANSSRIKLDGIIASRQTFAEDFMMEHSSTALHVTLVGMAEIHGVAVKDTQPSTQHFGFPA
jgi:hypothetical protein